MDTDVEGVTDMGTGKNWTREEDEYLIEKWGTVSVKHIAKKTESFGKCSK